MKYLARCVVRRFDDLAALCYRDPTFPESEAGWQALIAQADDVLLAEGGNLPAELEIAPQVFEQWCQAVSVIPCIDALKGYVIVQRARQALENDPDRAMPSRQHA